MKLFDDVTHLELSMLAKKGWNLYGYVELFGNFIPFCGVVYKGHLVLPVYQEVTDISDDKNFKRMATQYFLYIDNGMHGYRMAISKDAHSVLFITDETGGYYAEYFDRWGRRLFKSNISVMSKSEMMWYVAKIRATLYYHRFKRLFERKIK